MKTRPVEVELFHVVKQTEEGRQGSMKDRQTDMTKLRIAFRNFWNAPKGQKSVMVCTGYIFDLISAVNSMYSLLLKDSLVAPPCSFCVPFNYCRNAYNKFP